jgi:hypothetical protein
MFHGNAIDYSEFQNKNKIVHFSVIIMFLASVLLKDRFVSQDEIITSSFILVLDSSTRFVNLSQSSQNSTNGAASLKFVAKDQYLAIRYSLE